MREMREGKRERSEGGGRERHDEGSEKSKEIRWRADMGPSYRWARKDHC